MPDQWSARPNPFDWGVIGDVLVTRSVAGTISDASWTGMLEDLRRSRVRLIFSLGYGSSSVTAVQRKAVADLMKTLDTSAVVVTDDRMTRGILTAVSWLGAKIQSHPWDKLDNALAALGVSGENLRRLTTIAEQFKKLGA